MLADTLYFAIEADNKSPRAIAPAFIVIHSTIGRDSREYLKTGGGRSVSIHKLIQKIPRANGTRDLLLNDTQLAPAGKGLTAVYTMVPDNMVANHAGYSRVTIGGVTYSRTSQYSANQSLGIELENFSDPKIGTSEPYTTGQLLAMGECINNWRAKFGPLPVFRHEDIDASLPGNKSGKYDPVGLSLHDIDQWCILAANALADTWSLWGNTYDLHRDWAIPQAWHAKANRLGAPISPEIRNSSDPNTALQYFERGICVYNQLINRAVAIVYSEM